VAKDSSKIIDGELQRLLESWGQKAYKKKNQTTKQTLGRVSRKVLLAPPKINTSIFSCQTCNFKRDRIMVK